MWRWKRKLTGGFSKNGERFLELLVTPPTNSPLHVSHYLIWYCINAPHTVDLVFLKPHFDFIFRYENKYHISISESLNLRPLMNHLPWFSTNIVLIFEHSNLWPVLQDFFVNFRSLETNELIDGFNIYNTFVLTRKAFTSPDQDNPKIIQLPDHSLPKRYRHLRGGVNFGMLKDDKVVSFAAARHILHQTIYGKNYSFALLRGVETNALERRQGYADMTVKTLCNELFFRHNILRIYIWVERANVGAAKMYQKIGFQQVGKLLVTYCDLK